MAFSRCIRLEKLYIITGQWNVKFSLNILRFESHLEAGSFFELFLKWWTEVQTSYLAAVLNRRRLKHQINFPS